MRKTVSIFVLSIIFGFGVVFCVYNYIEIPDFPKPIEYKIIVVDNHEYVVKLDVFGNETGIAHKKDCKHCLGF